MMKEKFDRINPNQYIQIIYTALHDIRGYVDCCCAEEHVRQYVELKISSIENLTKQFGNSIKKQTSTEANQITKENIITNDEQTG